MAGWLTGPFSARPVGPAMRNGIGHPSDAFWVDRLGAFDMEDTGNAAHDYSALVQTSHAVSQFIDIPNRFQE